MSVKTVDLHEFERSVGSCIDFVSAGNEIVITHNDAVQARLVAPEQQVPKQPRQAGLNAGKVWIADDFDDPLPDSFWLGENE